MATIITSGENIITPTIVLEFETTSDSQSNVHPIIGQSIPDVTLRPAAARTGHVTLGFEGETSEDDSAAAEALLRTAAVFTVVSDDRPTVGLSFIVHGSVSRNLDDDSRDAWTVTCNFREVTA